MTTALLLIASCDHLLAHASWPTFYSAKSEIALAGDQLRVAVTIEVPMLDLVMAFNQHYADIDLLAEIRKGNIEQLEDEFRNEQFRVLAAGLELELDGELAAGDWQPAETPINGRATEGFFAYILEFRFAQPPRLGRALHAVVRNRLFPEVDIVLANLAHASAPWALVESSTPQPPPDADLTIGSPGEVALWSDESSRRTFDVSFVRH